MIHEKDGQGAQIVRDKHQKDSKKEGLDTALKLLLGLRDALLTRIFLNMHMMG